MEQREWNHHRQLLQKAGFKVSDDTDAVDTEAESATTTSTI